MTTTQVKTKAKKKAVGAKRSALARAEGEQCFWCCDGQILGSLSDLEEALSRMSGETYGYHVTDDKNDFAVWVECALSDKECADALRKAKTQTSASSRLKRHLKVHAL